MRSIRSRGLAVLFTSIVLTIALGIGHFFAIARILGRQPRDLLLLAALDAAVVAIVIVWLAWYFHRLAHERSRHAMTEGLVDALSVPATIEETAERAMEVLVEAKVAQAGILAVVRADDDDAQRLRPVTVAGARKGWTAEPVASTPALSRLTTRREAVTDDPWLLGLEITVGRRPWVTRLPIERGGEMLGQLVLASRHRGWLGDPRLLRTISASLAAALDHGRQYQVAFERTRDLEEQNARRREFLYAIAHELRSPLTSIQAFADLLSTDRSLIDGDSDLLMSSLSRGVDRLATFVNDLLDLGRVEETGLHMPVERIDVGAALRGAETMLRPSFMAREQALTLDMPDEPLCAVGNERALEQVILNLLSNANRFTPTRGAVTVRLSEHDGRVRIEVQDSGPGIDPRDREKIFDPFYRVHRAGAPEVPGSGLGLAVARRLTEVQGGRIWADAIDGVPGSHFCVELQAAERELSA